MLGPAGLATVFFKAENIGQEAAEAKAQLSSCFGQDA